MNDYSHHQVTIIVRVTWRKSTRATMVWETYGVREGASGLCVVLWSLLGPAEVTWPVRGSALAPNTFLPQCCCWCDMWSIVSANWVYSGLFPSDPPSFFAMAGPVKPQRLTRSLSGTTLGLSFPLSAPESPCPMTQWSPDSHVSSPSSPPAWSLSSTLKHVLIPSQTTNESLQVRWIKANLDSPYLNVPLYIFMGF